VPSLRWKNQYLRISQTKSQGKYMDLSYEEGNAEKYIPRNVIIFLPSLSIFWVIKGGHVEMYNEWLNEN
jgi:hypothetical protein